MKNIPIILLILAVAVFITACNASSTGPISGTQANNQLNNAPPSNPPPGNQPNTPIKLSESRFANDSYLISGDTLDATAQQATTGFSINKVTNPDGTQTISLTSSNPEYKNQSYTLQSGQQLYFIERFPGDDVNDTEGDLRDDTAIIVDADGYIISGYTPGNNPGNNSGGFRGNLTDAQRQQFNQQRIDACNGKTENDACTMSSPRGEINGTCQQLNTTLECMARFNRTG